MIERTVIPKDCCVCDVCNIQLTDENFIAIADSEWYRGWLYCMDCKQKYKPEGFLELIQKIKKGDDLSKTELALPIIMEFGSEDKTT